LERLGRRFATVLDCGLFHALDGDERPGYVASLASVTEPGATLYVLCFSDEGPDAGPHPVRQDELREAFHPGAGWTVAAVQPERLQTRFHDADGAPAWLATIERIETATDRRSAPRIHGVTPCPTKSLDRRLAVGQKSPHMGEVSVLLAEDHVDTRDGYALYLESRGLEVDLESTGDDVLRRLRDRVPDAVVMDMGLPVLDGWEATRRIRADPRWSDLPIVAVTGHAFEAHRRRAEDAGCNSFLPKPCLPEQLHLEILRVLSTRWPARPGYASSVGGSISSSSHRRCACARAWRRA
jgi:CheY-like chemotaxis protein